MITYVDSIAGIRPENLEGFFEGWPNPPSPQTHLKLPAGSAHVVLAVDEQSGNVAGFITAISDGILCAAIPLLEVLPAYRGRGIGRELVSRMLEKLSRLYMVDLICDPTVQPFYERCGLTKAAGMMLREHELQSGLRKPVSADD